MLQLSNPGTSRRITSLLQKIPALSDHFIIHHKIGEGTFSSVYLASLKNSNGYNQDESKIAIKHLIPTCSPARIIQEISCLKNIGGTDNVVSLKQCLRKDDNCVFIMPYLPHLKFSDYYMDMDVEEIKLYMKNLLIALRRVHSFKIIHRDVKPANFLYDRESKRFLLVDFGLAENVGKRKYSDDSQSTVSENTPTLSKKRKHSHLADENDNGDQSDLQTQPARKRLALHPLTNVANVKDGPPVLQKAVESPPSAKKENSMNLSPLKKKSISNQSTSNKQIDESHSNFDTHKKTDLKSSKLDSTVENLNANNRLLSPKRLPLVINTASNILNNISPKKHFPSISSNMIEKKINHLNHTISCSNMIEKKMNHLNHTISYDSKFIPRRLDLNAKTSTDKVFKSLLPTREEKSTGPSYVRVQNSQVQPVFQTPNSNSALKKPTQTSHCRCDSKPQVCNVCLVRHKHYAPRAGTPGYRPPEVLLKYQLQTTAVDVWSAGIIFLSILSGSYPFFQSRDDLTALTEIMTVFGSSQIKNLATKLGKNLICSSEKPPLDLKQMCERLRRRKLEAASLSLKNRILQLCPTCDHYIYPVDRCVCYIMNDRKTGDDKTLNCSTFPDSAYDLLQRLLDIDPDSRITAEDALNHPFLLE